jgi:hypothetical protein
MQNKLEQMNVAMAREYDLVSGEEVTYEQARNAITNPANFAKKVEFSDVEIEHGVRLAAESIELDGKNFTNMYDVSFDNNVPDLGVEILTQQHPLYPHRLFMNRQKDSTSLNQPIACINGAFFFLQDEKLEKVPSEIIYNLNIREGKIHGLPAVNRRALFVTKDGHLHATELEARGQMMIGNQSIEWLGGEPLAHKKINERDFSEQGKAILYNSACCTIRYENPNDKTSLRKLRQDLNRTPRKEDVTDIVVSIDEKGELRVASLNNGGDTDFFEGNFVLQMKNSEAEGINIGDEVDPKTVGELNLHEIKSAMTTGPSVHHFLNHDDHEINHDPSLGTFPPFDPNARYARSVIYEDNTGFIHMVVFDAVPRSENMKGVTPREVAHNIPQDVKWSAFLDGGQSSRLTFELTNPKTGPEIDSRGNMQYVRLHKRDKKSQVAQTDGQFLWSRRGRPLSSMIVVSRHK